MSYQGYGRMPMPMPFGANQPPPNQYPVSSAASNVPYPTASQPSTYGAVSSLSGYAGQQQQIQSSINTSEIDRWMEELISQLSNILKDAPKTELEQLVNNEDKLIELVQDSDQTKKLSRKREELVSENKDQAVTNMTLEPEIDMKKTEIVQLANTQNELQEKYSQLQHQLAGKISLDSISAILQAAVSEAESDSDKISQDFLDGSKSVEEFLEEYISNRTIYQLRKVKSEKMTDLLQTGAMSINRPSVMQRPTPIPRPRPGGYGGYGGY